MNLGNVFRAFPHTHMMHCEWEEEKTGADLSRWALLFTVWWLCSLADLFLAAGLVCSLATYDWCGALASHTSSAARINSSVWQVFISWYSISSENCQIDARITKKGWKKDNFEQGNINWFVHSGRVIDIRRLWRWWGIINASLAMYLLPRADVAMEARTCLVAADVPTTADPPLGCDLTPPRVHTHLLEGQTLATPQHGGVLETNTPMWPCKHHLLPPPPLPQSLSL